MLIRRPHYLFLWEWFLRFPRHEFIFCGAAWMDNQHAKQGNVGLADGSVEFFSRTNLQDALRNLGDKARAAGVFALAQGASGLGMNRIQMP